MIRTRMINRCLLLLMMSFLWTSCNDSENSRSNNGFDFNWGDSESETNAEEVGDVLAKVSEADLERSEEVRAFYKDRSNEAIWTEEDMRASFFDELSKAEDEGLISEEYHREEIQNLLESDSRTAEENARLEVLLTDAYLSYARDLFYGKLNPEELHTYWGVNRKRIDLREHFQKAVGNGNISGALNELRPSQQVYHDLQVALKEYRELKERDTAVFTRVEPGELVRPGESDSRITQLAARLKELNLLDPSYAVNNNNYDETLVEAVKEFQKEKNLTTDGLLGETTYAELNMTPTERYNQILANLERWRWYPRDLGDHYILINIPDFRLAVVREGDTVRTHEVVAGRKKRPTPIFTDTLQYIVINPEWTIPPTIKSQDVIPAASRDISYLRENNMIVTNQAGETIDPSNIDWSSDEVENYTFVQKAGASNPLGRVKIIYPNDYLIYLHDTPAQSLFSQNERAESSGCVRVENALDLSAYVVNNQPDWDQDRIREVISNGRTTQVEITQPIQVHHFYWTAWMDNGEIVFAEDVYELDKNIYTALLEDRN